MSEAMWAMCGVIVGGLISSATSLVMQKKQISHEVSMYKQSNLGKDSVKTILLEMLNHRNYIERSYWALRERVGGFTDDELRQILHEIGARRTSRSDGLEEWWYLHSRENERRRK